ncbi:DISARM system phospholipase D-like protein DrmC [Pyxidicoccus parkwayensis]|uniref:DISARM system phospholipase D-like protein DrmC n=1 Tax=Pyxidicoccus parkwayensis TaxID=2813578 RepID=A0ABX7NKM3_9BACT|nr:DISARM system phospholipase D-like protein DrmC [Pyxidicoccus parkwaysis]QSQ19188.1 DISARM system phospholipase D-like protein DrmC [Pyxidicoccus parkwaysis]
MDLSGVATLDLERLRAVVGTRRLGFPLSRLALQGEGLERLTGEVAALNALGREGALVLLDTVLVERRAGARRPELVWTGPETRWSGARDTAVVLADLFHKATSTVLVAGFAFDHAADVLGPLHEALQRGVSCRLYASAPVASAFLREHWPFGPPFPECHGFSPRRGVFASLHAKCVVVDARWVFVTSANFTDRGQTRNIEVGVLLEDTHLAAVLEAQFSTGEWFSRVA